MKYLWISILCFLTPGLYAQMSVSGNVKSSQVSPLAASATTDATNSANVNYTGTGTGAVARTVSSKLSDVVNVLDFGVYGDGKTDTSASITAASKNLVTVNAVFSSGDVGKYITVEGAAGSGGPLVTTIASYTDSKHVTLTQASTTAVTSGGTIMWGHNDTTSFQNAVNAAVGKKLVIPNTGGQYDIGDITVPSNTYLKFQPGAYVMAVGGLTQNSTASFTLFNIYGVSNVTIEGYGATIAMPFVEYNYEYNHCINIQNSTEVNVMGVYVTGCGGDGFYIAGDGSTAGSVSSRVHINDVWVDHVHRNGVSFISAQNVDITNSKFTQATADGDAPSYNNPGVDFEPNTTTDILQDINLTNISTASNKGPGVELSLNNFGSGTLPVSISVDGLYSYSDGYGAIATTAQVTAPVAGMITFRHVVSNNSGNFGIWIHNWNVDDPLIDIIDPMIINPNNSVSAQEGMSIDDGGGNTLALGNVAVHGLSVIDNRGTSKTNWPYVAADYSNIGASNIIVTLKYVSGVTNGYQNEGATYSVEEPYLQTLATPTFDASVRSDENSPTFHVTLNKSMAAGSIINAKPGQILNFQICRNATTTFTFAWPTTLRGATAIGTTANTCNTQSFIWYNTYGTALSAGTTNK